MPAPLLHPSARWISAGWRSLRPGAGRWRATCLGVWLVLAAALSPLVAASAPSPASTPAPSPAPSPATSPGPGPRSLPPANPVSLCLLSPHSSGTRAVVPLRRPTLFVADPLQEIRLLQHGRPVWRNQATSAGALHGPIAWPLAPIRPGETFTLLLRPQGAEAGAFARVELVGADPARLDRGDQLLEQLQRHPQRWHAAVEQALAAGDLPLAAALLFAVEGPSQNALDALRRDVFQQACGNG